MAKSPARKRIHGWMMFDWASQPYNTLLLTFIFGPYFGEVLARTYMDAGMEPVSAKASAQTFWAWGIALGGVIIAIMAPVLGSLAETTGRRMPYVVAFSALYVIGASALWYAVPDTMNVYLFMGIFLIGLVGMEFATIFTNAMLPSLGNKSEIGLISGKGFSLGYLGGLIALLIMLLALAENGQGRTLLGNPPAFGLNPDMREGTRSVGPLTAIWFAVFMIPFFMWVREPKPTAKPPRGAIVAGLRDLGQTIKKLPRAPSMASFLLSSMFYRDALNGMYTFGGIYATGVLGWTVVDIGVFGILAVIAGAIAAYLGGLADRRFGPKPVIVVAILILFLAAIGIVLISRDAVLFIPVSAGSNLPDIAFYTCGCLTGAGGGVLQSASRTMMVRQGNPERMTEAFGLYAMTGKATAFLAPALIAVATQISDSQRIGVSPIIALFLIGLVLLIWVKPDGEDKSVWENSN